MVLIKIEKRRDLGRGIEFFSVFFTLKGFFTVWPLKKGVPISQRQSS
jgi:hypothetical protein